METMLAAYEADPPLTESQNADLDRILEEACTIMQKRDYFNGEDLMNIGTQAEILIDAEIKRSRVREYLSQNGFDGLLISTREHFAWVTGGGDSHVVRNSNIGFGTIVITKDKSWLVAHSMDAARLFEEQAAGQGYELVTMRWYDGDVRKKPKN